MMQSTGHEHLDSFDFLFKIILVGDSDVGKTCVVQSFKTGVFSENQQNTIGVDFTVRTLDVDGKKIKVSHIIYVYTHMSTCAYMSYKIAFSWLCHLGRMSTVIRTVDFSLSFSITLCVSTPLKQIA